MEALVKDGKMLRARVSPADKLAVLLDRNRWRIARELAKQPSYPAELAGRLRMNEQVVYYHIRKLEAAGLIKVAHTEARQGAVARYYSLSAPAFAVVAKEEWKPYAAFVEPPEILEGFVEGCCIIAGSPDPHGPQKARARDCYFGTMLALFLGRLGAKAAVRLDTEVREKELEDNLICIGGPVTNLITARFVEQMPIRFATKDSWAIVSKISGEEYGEDTNGLIVRIPNPLKKGKSVLILAGKGIEGTRAAVIALAKHPNLRWHNLHDKANFAKVVEGVDLDGDGIVDDVEVRE